MNIEGIKAKAKKEKLSLVRSSTIKTVSETLGEVTIAIREYTSGENRKERRNQEGVKYFKYTQGELVFLFWMFG